MLRSIGSILWSDCLELVFPTRCLGCGVRGTWFCVRCSKQSELTLNATSCQICQKKTEIAGKLCRSHQRSTGLTGLVSFGRFRNPALREAIHAFKYAGVAAAGESLSHLAWQRWQVLNTQTWEAIVPIPLTRERLLERGYNQAELLARPLAAALDQPLCYDLQRIKHTKRQVGLPRAERQENVAGVFSWNGDPLSGNVLLVDDVVTTGSTLGAAAQVLRTAGATHVWAATLAYDD